MWWDIDGRSALGERLVYGGSLAAGNQTLCWICLSGGKRLKLYVMLEKQFSVISVEGNILLFGAFRLCGHYLVSWQTASLAGGPV